MADEAKKHVDNFNAKHAKPGETVLAHAFGYLGAMMGKGADTQVNGALIVTRERVVFHRKGWFGEVLESIPLKAITSIERRSFLGHRVIRLHTSHDALEFKTFGADAERSLLDAIETGRVTVPPPSQSATSHFDALRELARLRDDGVVSEAEFQAKKAELLGRL